jgi:hypothetical protein
MKDAIEETRQQISRLAELEELHEMCIAGFHNPNGHGLLKSFEEDDK